MSSNLFKNLQNVDNAIKLYRLIAIVSIALSFATIVTVFIIAQIQIDKERNSVYAITTEGVVINMRKFDKMDKRDIEAKAHVKTLLMYLFDTDKFTYKTKLKQALALGNNEPDKNSILKFYKQQEQKGTYSQMEQYNIRFSLEIKSIECTNQQSYYSVNTTFDLFVNGDGMKSEVYNGDMTFMVVENGMERSESNPNGFFVTDITTNQFEKETN